MAYSDYGAFVWLNGERRRDKEDVGVFDADEASLPSGMRIYANLIKNHDGEHGWWEHSQHGVMGDGNIRVSCFKQGFPTIWHWPSGHEKPDAYSFDFLCRTFGWTDFEEHGGVRYAEDAYEKVFDFMGIRFRFWGDEWGDSPCYSASMKCRDGLWICQYDYMYGAGLTECPAEPDEAELE